MNDDQPFLEIVTEIREFIRECITARRGGRLSSADDERAFAELGLDLESQRWLDTEVSLRFGVVLADFATRAHGSPASLARYVAHVLTGDLASAAEPETLRSGSSPPGAGPSRAELPSVLTWSIESE